MFFFFFKQKTAYEMRISDWSSDVCSSDLSSNHEGTMTVIGWDGADALRHLATIRTSPGARMMDIDHRSGRLYLVNADATEFPGKDGGVGITRYHPDSFRVDTWQPN